jgi:hypothetical protein
MKTELLLVLTLSLFFTKNIEAQDFEKKMIKRNSCYFELRGIGDAGALYYLSYDRIFLLNKKSNLDIKAGIGYNHMKDWKHKVFDIPVSVNYSLGKQYHHFEVGTGLAYNSGFIQEYIVVFRDPGGRIDTDNCLKALWNITHIGYKYQRPNGGVFFKFSIGLYSKIANFSSYHGNTDIMPYLGLGIGYTF